MRIDLFQRAMIRWSLFRFLKQNWPDDRAFLHAAYRTYLKRVPDDEGFLYYLQALQDGKMNRQSILHSITLSSEFRHLYGLPIHPLDALHQSRMMLVQHHLPPAQVIVDLGGAAEDHEEGALLVMGYPHRPQMITIVDLPPSQRLGGAQHAELSQSHITTDATRVRYLYGPMTELSLIEDTSADLVWSGESIEHVTEDEADMICKEAFRILKPGGYFCLDTPNAKLVRLQSPTEFIHPEHKKEYCVAELTAKLEKHGFQIVEAKGISPMPESLKTGVFIQKEMVRHIGLSDDPNEGYLFYLSALKPPSGGSNDGNEAGG